MKLMKMLSVSKSFMAEKTQPCRYRMTDQGALPKFAAVGRPVKLSPAKSKAPSDPKKPGAGKRPDAPPRADRSRTKPPASFAPGIAPEPPAPPASTNQRLCLNAVTRTSNFFRLRSNPFGNDIAQPVGSQPLQAELTLDAVKPVWNDLSDADLEIVSAPALKVGTEAAQTTGRERRFHGESIGMVFSRLAGRLFQSSRARA